MIKTFLYFEKPIYSLEGTDVKVIAIDLEQHFLDYGKVAKGRSPLNRQFFSKTALRIFMIFCVKVPYY